MNKIRSSGEVIENDQLELAKLLSHLEIRSRNLRESIRSTSSILIDHFFDTVSETKNLRPLMADFVLNEPELILIPLGTSSISIPRNQKRVLLKSLRKEILDGELDSEIIELFSSIENNRKDFKNNISEGIDNALKMVMRANIEPEKKVSLLSRINYEVVELSQLPLPLGSN